jgi:hypothetical protein
MLSFSTPAPSQYCVAACGAKENIPKAASNTSNLVGDLPFSRFLVFMKKYARKWS